MQSVIKRPCPATRIHFQPYGQPSVERKTTTGERHPAASSRGYPSAGSHPRKGRRPRCPGNLLPPPIPGKTPGPGMPGPYRAAVGKPYAVRKRPRRGQDPSLRTVPSTSAHTPPQVRAATRQRAAHPRRGRRPRRPGNLPSSPIPGKTSGPGMPGPYRAAVGKPYAIHKRPRRGQDPSLRTDPPTSAHTLPRGGGQAPCRPQTPAEGSRPLPTDRPINEFPPPCRAAVRERRQKNRGDPFSRDCLGSLYKAI